MTTTQPGTPGWLRTRNDRLALALLLEHGPLTRNRLGELSGLSKPTAALMVSRLEEAGLIHVVGEASGGRGPNAAVYAVRNDRLRAVAIDIRETVMSATVVDATRTEHPIVEIPVLPHSRTPEGDVRQAIDTAVTAAGVERGSVQLVAIGVQAAVSDSGDTLAFSETLPGWPEHGARRAIEAALELDVTIDNDVNLAAVAERAVGAAAGSESVALLWMGSGLGVALDLDGRLHRGATGSAGEIGSLSVPRAAIDLAPDARDLTELIGGPAVTRILRRHGARGKRLSELLARLPDDAGALDELAPRIALSVIPLVAILDPQLVVLGGPTGLAGGAALAERVAAQVARLSRWRTPVVATAAGPAPVLTGARELLVAELHRRLDSAVTGLPG
ncbi:ROK family protein [Galbitalea soli]|uniref:ROK family transcriptional regulator n=1 Tax=Galbitalea soli TaxID=1268042 RepID=A0A7C9PL35_9MICO|nr:ROK family transcriptional regulator [Galbitalea soli]NYJ30512.1 putative NBD/HSP70 family sugar kinase [Galbitalea soli]